MGAWKKTKDTEIINAIISLGGYVYLYPGTAVIHVPSASNCVGWVRKTYALQDSQTTLAVPLVKVDYPGGWLTDHRLKTLKVLELPKGITAKMCIDGVDKLK